MQNVKRDPAGSKRKGEGHQFPERSPSDGRKGEGALLPGRGRFPGTEHLQAVGRGSDLPHDQARHSDGDPEGSANLHSDLAEQEDGQDPHRLFDQLGDSRNTGGPAPQIISHDAAVKGGKGEGIGEDHKELGAAGLLKESLGDPPGEALKEESTAAGGSQGEKDGGAQKFPGFCFPAGGDPSRHAAGEGSLDAGAGQGETKGIDGKDQLVEPYAFLAESVA